MTLIRIIFFYIYNSLSNYTISLFKYIKNKTQTFEFFVLMLGIVTNLASVVPLIVTRGHHHPSIDFSLRTPFPIILYQDSDC